MRASTLQAKPGSDTALFRREVLAQRQSQWLGSVLLAPDPSFRLLSVFAVLVMAGVMALLWFGHYASKARLNGWLMPQQGLVRMVAPQAGVVTRVDVHEGMEVTRGAPLLELSSDLNSAALGATGEAVVRRLKNRRDSLVTERDVRERLVAQQSRNLSQRLAALLAEQEHLQSELRIQGRKARLAEDEAERYRGLRDQHLITEERLQIAQQEGLEQAARLQSLERNQAGLDRERAAAEGELRELPLKAQEDLAELDRAAAALEQELAEAEARRRIVIAAPEDGTVTGIQVDPGTAVGTTLPLLNILPAGARLQAQLFSQGSTIGLIRPGQRALLRYRAFPYQRYGFYSGTVVAVARSAVSPADLPQQMSGLTSLFGANEPVYRVTVELASQFAMVNGDPVPLMPGMQLDADVIIERRRLIDWILDPYHARGRPPNDAVPAAGTDTDAARGTSAIVGSVSAVSVRNREANP